MAKGSVPITTICASKSIITWRKAGGDGAAGFDVVVVVEAVAVAVVVGHGDGGGGGGGGCSPRRTRRRAT